MQKGRCDCSCSFNYKFAGFDLVEFAGLQDGLVERMLVKFVEIFERVFHYVVVVVYINLWWHERREL